jgi:hypothetical protein
MLIFILIVVGIIVAQIADIPWLEDTIMIVGCIALFGYTIFASIQFKKKVY